MSRLRRLAALVALPLAACSGPSDGALATDAGDRADPDGGAPPDASEPFVCPSFAPIAETGAVESDDVTELSGVVASVDQPGLLWGHNDDDGPAELFGFTAAGALVATARIDAEVTDFEDVTRVAVADGSDRLFLADIGDNARERATIAVHRIDEPTVDLGATGAEIEVAAGVSHTLRYPDGAAHDAEAIVLEPGTGDLYLFTKSNGDDDALTRLYRAPALAESGGGNVILELVLDETTAPGLTGKVVTATLSPDRRLLLVGFKDDDFRLWPVTGSIAETIAGVPCQAPSRDGQIEGAAFLPDGSGYLMVEDGSPDLAVASYAAE